MEGHLSVKRVILWLLETDYAPEPDQLLMSNKNLS